MALPYLLMRIGRLYSVGFQSPLAFWAGGGGALPGEVEPEPEPEPVPEVVSGGVTFQPRLPLRRLVPIEGYALTGQGRQSSRVIGDVSLSALIRSQQWRQSSVIIGRISVDLIGRTEQAQNTKGTGGLVIRGAMRGGQSSQDGAGECGLKLKGLAASGGETPQEPKYTGKPLPKVLIDD